MEAKLLEIKRIRTDGGTQPRAELHEDIIAEYAQLWRDEPNFPKEPVTVFYDGKTHWLAHGFHRVESAKRAGVQAVQAEIRPGTLADAQWFSFGVNQDHGLRRSSEDKERAVRAALRHELGVGKSNSEISRHCGVNDKTVAKYRAEMESSSEIPEIENRTVKRGGATYQQDTTNIGRKSPRAKANEFLAGGPSDDLPESSDESSDDLPESPEPDPEPMTPVRGPGERVKKIALELPLNDPSAIVRTLMSFFSPDCLRRVVKELSKALEGA